MNPLARTFKGISLISLAGLIACQISLLKDPVNMTQTIIAVMLILPLLLPIRGLYLNRRYTYKWVGFLTLLYFIVGISEWFASDQHLLYSLFTILFSLTLYFSSILLVRQL